MNKQFSFLNKDTPIIALTAHLASDKWKECEMTGMQDLVAKPIDTAMLEALLAQV